jgi:hypothetical protein
MHLLPAMLTDAFFLHLLVAHAWILATSFHIDCGAQGQLALYTNTYNATADWSRLDDLKANPPYDSIVTWRDGQKPGGLLPGAQRVYGRLVDDSWQQALFTQPTLRDVSPEQIRGILRNVMLYRQGLLAGAESEFIGRLETVYRQHGHPAAA